MKLKEILTVLFSGALVFTVAFPVGVSGQTMEPKSAQQTLDQAKLKIQEMQAQAQQLQANAEQQINNAWQHQCALIQTRLNQLDQQQQTLRDQHLSTYQQVWNQASTLMTELQLQGVDTTQINAALMQLQTLINTLKSDMVKYFDALGQGNSVCGAPQLSFQSQLSDIQKMAGQIHADMLAISNQVHLQLEPALLGATPSHASIRQESDTTTTTTDASSKTTRIEHDVHSYSYESNTSIQTYTQSSQ